jgi:hypothetical protein
MRKLAASVTLGLALTASLPLAAPAATRAEWAKGANAVCARELGKMHALERQAATKVPLSLRQWVAMYDELVASFSRMRVDIAALEKPRADRASIETMVSYLGRAIVEMKAVRKATLARDTGALERHVTRSETMVRRAETLAMRLGARTCATG